VKMGAAFVLAAVLLAIGALLLIRATASIPGTVQLGRTRLKIRTRLVGLVLMGGGASLWILAMGYYVISH
jgi:hypothetical protein